MFALSHDVELRDLQWAIVASQHRSLRQAAEMLSVRQSTLSRRLGDLEYRLGTKLFERTNGGTHPTIVGREFLEAARRIVGQTEAALGRLKSRSTGEAGQLAIGLLASLATGNLHATLKEHRRRFPEVGVRTVDGNRGRLLDELAAGTIDVAIMTTCAASWDDGRLPLWGERVILALPEHHAMAAMSALRWPDLMDERILVSQHGPGPELKHLLIAKLHYGVADRMSHHDAGLDRLLALVCTGYGSLLMLEGGTGLRCDGLAYREVHDEAGPTHLNFSAYWRQTNGNPVLDTFLGMLRERYPDLSGAASPR